MITITVGAICLVIGIFIGVSTEHKLSKMFNDKVTTSKPREYNPLRKV